MSLASKLRAEADERIHRLRLIEAKDDPVVLSELAGIKPDPWQRNVLRSTSKRILLNCTRQGGKSTITGMRATHMSAFKPGALTLLFAPALRQCLELFRKVLTPYRAVPGLSPIVRETQQEAEFANGSRIFCLPENEATTRGFSAPDLIIIEEAAYCGDALYMAVRPMLATSNGTLLLLSSPNGQKGFFFTEATNPKSAFERYVVPATACARIPLAHLEEERQAMGPLFYSQEYECRFISGVSGLVYTYDPELNAIPKSVDCKHYLLAIDYGFNDECAFTVLGWNDNDPTVYVLSSKKYPGMIPSAAAEHTRALMTRYAFVQIVGDTGGLGKGYAEEARARFGIPIEAAEKNNKRGYIDLFNDGLKTRKVSVFAGACEDLIEEWKGLGWDPTRQREDARAPNHCADATLYGWRACTAFANRPKTAAPSVGTPEYFQQVEAAYEATATNDDSPANWWD